MPINSPADIASLRLWLTADAGLFQDTGGTTPASSDGDPVALWQDQSGQGNHLSQATAGNRPQLKLGVFNGRDVVRFDGSDDRLDTASAFLTAAGFNSAFSAFLAVRYPATGSSPAGTDIHISAGGAADFYIGRIGNGFPDVRFNLNNNSNHWVRQRYADGPGIEWYTFVPNFQVGGWRNRGHSNEFVSSMGFDAGGDNLTLGDLQTGGFASHVDIAEVCLFAGRLAGAEFHDMLGYLNDRYGPWWDTPGARFAVFEGDSLTQGTGSTNGLTYPEQCLDLLGPNYYGLAVGRAGEQTSEAAADAAVQVDAYWRGRDGDVVVFWAGTNDLFFNVSVATVQTRYQSYCEDRRAVGWKVVAVTMLPRSGTNTPAGFETARQAFNTWLRANWQDFADALADVAADERIGDAGDELDTTYYTADKVHLNSTGYGVVAEIVGAAVLGLEASGPPKGTLALLGVGR